jgi:hypothetical protein
MIGCASKRAKEEAVLTAPELVADSETATTPSLSPETTASTSPSEVLAPVTFPHEVSKLNGFQKVHVRLSSAETWFTGNALKKQGKLKVTLLRGSASECHVRVQEKEGGLFIEEVALSPQALVSARKFSGVGKHSGRSTVPSGFKCHYALELSLHEAGDLDLELKRGGVLVEQWNKPVTVKLDWGDVDVGEVGPLKVACGRCTLAGEGVEGSLQYRIENGNVGLAALSGTVDGSTAGDTVLKWRKMRADTKVKLVSHAGDVILSFPSAIPLSMELSAPRGEVYSLSDVGGGGIPVSVMAELGNVRLYRNTAK